MTLDVGLAKTGLMPELGETGIDVDHHASAEGAEETRARQVSADVDQVRLRSDRKQVFQRRADDHLFPSQQRRPPGKAEPLGDLPEPRRGRKVIGK